ncbi:MAG: hypothetical protein LUE89_00410 [Clostridiales bacterium]|nr:hypothetical protein [Clostridiales bacterium]
MGQKETAVSDEQVIAALMSSGSVAAAATACGLAPRTIYDRMRKPEFQEAYQTAKSDIVRDAVNHLNRQLAAAIETIAEIMQDEEAGAGTRLQAAKMILDNAGRFADRLEAGERTARKSNQTLDDLLFGMEV